MLQSEFNILKHLSLVKQKVFAYLTCERLFPNYLYFHDNFRFGNPNKLRKAIDFIYLNIFEDKTDNITTDALIKELEKNTPDTGDFDTIFVSSALDSCSAIHNSLLFLHDKDFSYISYIATAATDSIDMYIQHLEKLDFNRDPKFQEKINAHHLMQKEIQIQKGIIQYLSSIELIDYDDVNTLLNLQGQINKGNLGL